MTHIPVGKKLPVTEYVPLPKNRPEVPKTEEMPPVQDLQSSIHPTMPLEATEKPADALFQVGGYHPSSLDEIDLLSLPRGSDYVLRGTDLFKYYWNTYNPFNFSIYEDKHGATVLNIYNFESELLLWVVAVSVVGAILTGIILGTEKLLEYFNIISRDR